MKIFVLPEVEIRDFSPCQTLMDDITISKNQDTDIPAEYIKYADWKKFNDEAIW